MLRSLYSAVSGLDVNQKSMDVIGNNIANVNTIGFKEGRAVFQDLMSQTLIGGKTPTDARGGINPRQVGSGAYLAAVDNIFEPGILKATSRSADLAIQGNGLFVVRGEGAQERYYTRAGDFNFDRTGTLTSPSGYKVQGWMSDPTTGKLVNEGIVGDIVLGPAYKVMQAKASSEISLVGNLDTRAKSSILSYPKFLTQASAQQSIMSTVSESGKAMDLAKGEVVKIKAHATNVTSMKDVFNASDNSMNLKEGENVTFNFPADSKVPSFTLTYRSTPGAGGNDFNSVQEFTAAVNRNLFDNTVVPPVQLGTMTIDNGTFKIVGNSGTFNLTSVSGNSMISGLLSDLQGQYNTGHTRNTKEVFYVKEVKAGEHFNSLTELAMQVENAMNGTVVPGDFNVNYLTNNFGLNEGEGLRMSVEINGIVVTIPTGVAPAPASFTYTQSETPDATLGQFHTVNEMATLVKDAINAAAGTNIVNVGLVGNKIAMTYVGAVGAPTLSFGATTLTPGPGAGAPNPNPYLSNLLNGSLDGKALTAAGAIFVDEISGKGRLVYSNASAQAITGFSINKSNTGSKVFDENLVPGSNTIVANSSMTSKRFLAQADENAKIVDLFTPNGESFNFTENEASLLFNASVGGNKITSNNVFSIQVGTTILDLMASMEDFLGLGREHNSHQNVVMKDGSIVVTGEEGEDNAIDFFRFESTASNNNIFTNHMNPDVKQKASGGIQPTAIEIFDEQGNMHTLSVRFSLWNKEQNEWRMEVKTADPATSIAINGATSNELVIKFNSNGSLAYMYDRFTDPSTIITSPSLRFSAANGTNAIDNIALNIGTQGSRDGLTLSAAPGGFTTNETDGYSQGTLEQALFNPAGEIVGSYTNGEVRTLGQLALASFSNQQGLLKVGDTMFAETGNSGRATFGTAQTGGRGDINAGMLENSNVDLSRELVSMITTQRGFQASSKIISTSDEMIQELLAMKR